MNSPRTLGVLVAIALLGTLGYFIWLRAPETGFQPAPTHAPAAQADLTARADQARPNAEPTATVGARSELVDDLNSPAKDIHADLRVLQEVFAAFRSNFPQLGNPTGNNVEITAVLTGKNPLHLALIPRDHPAINARGELCDRWGHPFFFHQLSGTQMEIRSAGPDQKFWTDDDVVLTP